MQFQILLGKKMENNRWISLGTPHLVPWEMRDLAEASAGWTMINQSRAAAATELIPKLETGVFNLMNRPECYSLFELKHGIGAIDTMLKFFSGLLKECREYPFAELSCKVID
ncbi:hypothetical protein SDC9_122693 [bioreactor metagenome]|uniref:Uncharacterized protein n=1 Tax=bioreactor metagenome TaxID=1076179 RepID=A0A645CFE3_9ZZZZ